MATKELTKDSITGAIFDYVKVRIDKHWSNDEDVVELRIKQDKDSNSTNVTVLSLHAAYQLRHMLTIALDAQMREWAASQPKNWPDFAD